MNTRPLPAALIARQSYVLLWANSLPFIRFAFPWAALFFLIVLLRLIWSYSGERNTDFEDLFGEWLGAEVTLFVLSAVVATAIAAPWQRHLLAPTLTPRPFFSQYMRYALRTMIVLGVVLVVPVVFYTIVIIYTFDELVAWVCFAGAVAIGGVIATRLATTLPAMSIGVATPTLHSALMMTRSNGLRLFAGAVACIGPVAIIAELVLAIVWAGDTAITSLPTAIASAFTSTVTWTAETGLVATYLSLAYRFFTGEQEQDINSLREEFK